MLRLVIFGLFVVQASGVINRLTPLEYEKLPRLMHVDEYEPCMHDPGDTYCFVHAHLFGNLSDPIYNLTVEYSANTITHFNHTQIHWGICPKTTCHEFLGVSSNRTEMIEACLNDTFTNNYKMTTRVYNIMCEEYKEGVQFDAGDYAFTAVILVLLTFNVLGSLYDFFSRQGKQSLVGKLLMCFSVRGNWRRLAAPPNSNSMQNRIRVIYCFRSITALLVVLGHAPLPGLVLSKNTQFFEEMFHNPLYVLIVNGTLVVQTFFLMSGFLLAYNLLLSEEKRPPSWMNLPKGIILRWLRLTPVYALVLFYVMTWARHVASGPYHLSTVLVETKDCYQDWWLNLLYIQNYKDYSQCMAHAWYLAADFQLTVLGLIIFCLLYSNRARKLAIGVLLVVGLLMTGVHTFVQNLHAILIVAPEVALNFFITDPTFNNLYKRGHTNLVCYALGMAAGYVVFKLKDSDIGAKKFKLFTVWAGAIFYIDDIVIPIAVSVVYSGGIKLVFGLLNCLFMFFTIVKVDRVYRGFLHWPGWARISRLTYLAFLIHVPILRYGAAASSDVQIYMSLYWFIQNYAAVLSLSFVLAIPLFILVESPLAEVVKMVMIPAPKTKEKPVRMVAGAMSSKETIEIKL